MDDKKCCISLGTCNKKYWLLILGIVITYIILMIFVHGLNNYNSNSAKNFLNIFSYTFLLSLGESLMVIPELVLKKKISSTNNAVNSNNSNNYNNRDSKSKQNNKIKNRTIKYIFNKKSINFSLKEKIFYYSAGILKLFLDIMFILYQYVIEKDDDFKKVITFSFQFELLFLFLLSKILYNIQFYRHQYLAIIILTLFGLAKFIIKYYNKGVEKVFLYTFAHIIYSFTRAFIIVYIKGLMEYKYITPYRACYKYGLINLIIITIGYIIVSFLPCDDDNESCNVIFNERHYYAHILDIFSIPGLFMFIIFLLKAIILVLDYIIILEFSVCHSFLFIELNQILETSSFKNIKDTYFYSIIVLIFFFLGIFFVLLFLEMIELNICKISYNTKRNIESRAKVDSFYSILNYIEADEEEEIEEYNTKNDNNS